MNNPILQYLLVDNKTQRALNLFWGGFILYSLFYALTARGDINFAIVQVFQTLGLGLIFAGALQLIRFRLDSTYMDILFKGYMIWQFLVIFRGFTTDYELIKKLLYDAWFGVFVYLTPLVLLFPRNLALYRKVFEVIIVLGVLCVLLYFYFLDDLLNPDFRDFLSQGVIETVSKTLGIPAGFIILTYMYHSKPVKITAWIVLGLTVFFALLRARRGLIFMAMAPMVFAYILYMYNSKVKGVFIAISVLIGVGVINYAITLYERSDVFHSLKERGLEDTRTGVEVMFYKDMGTLDWVAGKGMNGTYYCPGIDTGNSTGQRYVIETDFLNIILKGGMISLFTFFLIAVPAVIKGIFFSSNNLSKAAAIWVLLGLINMYPSTVNTFTLNFVLVWICIGICHSPVIRNLPETVISSFFRQKNLEIGSI